MSKETLRINYEKKADKFFRKNSASKDEITGLIITAVRKLRGRDENIDLKRLKGKYQGYFRIRKGEPRIVFHYLEGNNLIVVTLANIDFRGKVY